MDIGRAIRILRSIRGTSQKKLAKDIARNASFISLIEKNQRNPSQKTLHELAGALDVPVYLLTLLASEPNELRGISREQADFVGRELVRLLASGDAPSDHGEAR